MLSEISVISNSLPSGIVRSNTFGHPGQGPAVWRLSRRLCCSSNLQYWHGEFPWHVTQVGEDKIRNSDWVSLVISRLFYLYEYSYNYSYNCKERCNYDLQASFLIYYWITLHFSKISLTYQAAPPWGPNGFRMGNWSITFPHGCRSKD